MESFSDLFHQLTRSSQETKQKKQSFHSRSGRAYLFDEVANVSLGDEASRLMTTGAHVVRDAFCNLCKAGPIGWHYVSASDPSQAYKVGRTILERAAVVDRVEGFEGEDAESDDDECEMDREALGGGGGGGAVFVVRQSAGGGVSAAAAAASAAAAAAAAERFGRNPVPTARAQLRQLQARVAAISAAADSAAAAARARAGAGGAGGEGGRGGGGGGRTMLLSASPPSPLAAAAAGRPVLGISPPRGDERSTDDDDEGYAEEQDRRGGGGGGGGAGGGLVRSHLHGLISRLS